MNTNQIKGRVSQVRGKVKEITGRLFRNKQMEGKGYVEKTGGKVEWFALDIARLAPLKSNFDAASVALSCVAGISMVVALTSRSPPVYWLKSGCSDCQNSMI